MNCIISIGVEKAEWRAGEMQSRPIGTPRDARDLAADLGGRQHAAVAGLGALAELQLDHLDLRRWPRPRRTSRREKVPSRVAAAEIARADLPDDVAAVLAVIGAEAALAGVVGEAAHLRALVERADGVGAERAEAHGRDVEHGGRVGLRAVRAADRRRGTARRDGGLGAIEWLHPLEAVVVDVVLRAERPLVELPSWRAGRRSRACRAENGAPSLSPSKKYCRISGRISSNRKRRCAVIG